MAIPALVIDPSQIGGDVGRAEAGGDQHLLNLEAGGEGHRNSSFDQASCSIAAFTGDR